jgi:hypothetical protein
VVLSGQTAAAQGINWYFNVDAPRTLDGGTVRFAADAGAVFRATLPIADPDGDPIWITWDPGAGGLGVTPVGPATALFNEQADFTAPATAACGTTSYPFTFRAADGWQPHTTLFTGFVDVTRNEPPGTPTLGSSDVTLYAGLGPQFVSYGPPATGCPGSNPTAVPTGSGFGVTAVDGGYLFTPDPTSCSLDGGGALTITNANDAGSSVVSVAVKVEPWGAPTVGAFSTGPSLVIDAGSSASFGLGSGHACEFAGDFPGIDVAYSVDGGVATPASRTSARVLSERPPSCSLPPWHSTQCSRRIGTTLCAKSTRSD